MRGPVPFIRQDHPRLFMDMDKNDRTDFAAGLSASMKAAAEKLKPHQFV